MAAVRTWHLLVVAAVAFAALGAAVAVLLLGRGTSTGATETVGVVAGQTADQAAQTAKANLRGALPAAEAYFAGDVEFGGGDGSYVGMTAAKLVAIDSGISPTLAVASVTATTYCLTDTVSGETWSIAGPGIQLSDFKNNATCA